LALEAEQSLVDPGLEKRVDPRGRGGKTD
jgi:hypothetical protein